MDKIYDKNKNHFKYLDINKSALDKNTRNTAIR